MNEDREEQLAIYLNKAVDSVRDKLGPTSQTDDLVFSAKHAAVGCGLKALDTHERRPGLVLVLRPLANANREVKPSWFTESC